jgi:hypothetical protein
VVFDVVDGPVEVSRRGGDAVPPLPDETTIAMITPATAAAATAAASTAFFTGSEATLAAQWLHASRSS